MAEKRMFARSVVSCDEFLDLPVAAQALYFQLALQADDDGFIGSPKMICRASSCSTDDLNALIERGFLISFGNSNVVVIRHWLVQNTIKSDRYHETMYMQEKDMLNVEDNKSYSVKKECFQSGSELETQYIKEKYSIDTEDNRKEKKIESEAETPCFQSGSKSETEAFAADSFQEMWNDYPKKTAEEEARKQYDENILSGITHLQMKNAVSAYLRESDGTEVKYLKKLVDFLRSESLITNYAAVYDEKYRASDEFAAECYL